MARHRETGIIRRVMADPATELDYWDHALDEMQKDDISQLDVETVLNRSGVVDVQPGPMYGPERWRIEGNDDDGRRLGIVIQVDESGTPAVVDVVTAWHDKNNVRR